MVSVTSAEIQRQFGRFREIAQREPVTITSLGRESLVMVSADEFKRLKALDAREAFFTDDLPDDIIAELEKGYRGEPTPDLDHLMK